MNEASSAFLHQRAFFLLARLDFFFFLQHGGVLPHRVGYCRPACVVADLYHQLAGFNLLHVPYKGTGPGTAAVMAGEIHILLVGLATVLPHVRSKSDKVKVLAVTSARRSPAAPEIPTVAEAGLPGYEFDVWYGMVLPGGVPAPVLAKTSTEIVRVMKGSALRERFMAAGLEPQGSSALAFAAQLKREIPTWQRVAREANISME